MTELRREWAMPNKWTFTIDPIADLLEKHMDDGLWIDPFAGKHSPADITNDLEPERDTDHTEFARDFLEMFDEGEVDGGVLVDPPYSPTQLKRKYDDIGVDVAQTDTNGRFMARVRDGVEHAVSPGAKVITFGWNTVGIGKTRGFEKEEILLVCHGNNKNDTICTVERYDP